MRVVVSVSKFYDWVPVPMDVEVTPTDIASGKVMPNKDGSGYRMRVVKSPPGGTQREIHISEADVIGKIIHEKTDVKRAGRTFSRKEAVTHLIMDHCIEDLEWAWITKWEVHDGGPDEALLRSMLEPHTQAVHARRGGMNIDPSHVDAHVKAYMEPAAAEHHAQHLQIHFGTKVAS